MKYCDDLKAVLGDSHCCWSCHEDSATGAEWLIDDTYQGEDCLVCCAVSRAISDQKGGG